jgi:thiol-disulfide isomerase/thioredoxin
MSIQNDRSTFNGIGVWFIIAALLTVLAGLSFHEYRQRDQEPTINVRIAVFKAKWCSKCPTEAEVRAVLVQYPNVELRIVDVDASPVLTETFQIHGRVPTFVIFNRVLDTYSETTRVYSLPALRNWLENNA